MNKNGKYTLIFAALAEMPLKPHDLPEKNQLGSQGAAKLRWCGYDMTNRQKAEQAGQPFSASLPAVGRALSGEMRGRLDLLHPRALVYEGRTQTLHKNNGNDA